MENRGPKPKYNEQTAMVAFRCPISKIEELRKMANDQLDKWKTKEIKLSSADKRLLIERKYTVRKTKNCYHVCRTVENARGKFNVLLAQDILGINCQIKFVDGNTLNNERENIKAVSRDVEYFY